LVSDSKGTRRRISEQKRNEKAGDWQKLPNKELHNFHSLPNIIRVIKSRRMRWAGYVAYLGETRNAYRTFVGKPERKRPLRIYISQWEENIKMDLRETGWDGMDWIYLAQDRDQWRRTFGFHKMLRNSSVAERLAASQILSSMELVSRSVSWLVSWA
jgi:hypothetical protein